MKKKIAILALAFVLVFALGIGGTLAWLTATTSEVKNTFTVGNISISLEETQNNGYQLIPGFTYKKNPTVTVDTNSVDCYLFVKFEEKNNPKTYLDYTSTLTTANGWTQGDGTDIPANVWYRKVKTTDATKSWLLLAKFTDDDGETIDKNIKVKESLTKDSMPTNAPELVYTAYACQLYSDVSVEFTAAEAWAKVNPSSAD